MSNGVRLYISNADNSLLSKANVTAMLDDLIVEQLIDLPWAVLQGEDIDFEKPRNMVSATSDIEYRSRNTDELLDVFAGLPFGEASFVLWFSGLNWDNYQIQAPLERQGYFNGNLFLAFLKQPRTFITSDGEVTLQHFAMIHGNRAPEEIDETALSPILARYFGDDYITHTRYYDVAPAMR